MNMIHAQNVILEPLRRRRERAILMLQEFADTADIIYQTRAKSDAKANVTSVIGGVFTMTVGGIMILTTGGLAAPVITGVSLAAGGTSIGGGVWSIKNGYDCASDVSRLEERIRNFLQEDEIVVRNMMEEILHRVHVRDLSVLEPAQVAREINGVIGGPLDANQNYSNLIQQMISSIPSVINIIQHGGFPVLTGMVVLVVPARVAKDITCTAVKEIIEKPVKQKCRKAVTEQVATTATVKVCKESTEEGVKTIATQTVTKVATKKVTMEATEEGAKSLTTEVVKKGAETGAKTAAKVAGAVTITFGGITAAWEGYNAYQNYRASHEESELGKELRRLARRLERSLITGNITY